MLKQPWTVTTAAGRNDSDEQHIFLKGAMRSILTSWRAAWQSGAWTTSRLVWRERRSGDTEERHGAAEERSIFHCLWYEGTKRRVGNPFHCFWAWRNEVKRSIITLVNFHFYLYFNFLISWWRVTSLLIVSKNDVMDPSVSHKEHVMYLPSGPFSKKNIGFTQTGWTMRTAGLYQFKTGFSRFPIGLIAECFQVVLDRT